MYVGAGRYLSSVSTKHIVTFWCHSQAYSNISAKRELGHTPSAIKRDPAKSYRAVWVPTAKYPRAIAGVSNFK